MRIQRLPVVPRPYRDELSTSCLGRVACRYGPDANELACYIVNDAPKPHEQHGWNRPVSVQAFPHPMGRIVPTRDMTTVTISPYTQSTAKDTL
jgi:hypothetical protein